MNRPSQLAHTASRLVHRADLTRGPRNHRNLSVKSHNRNVSKYCFDSVRKSDYENYLALLLIKDPRVRDYAFTVRAFNVELARVHNVTTENKIAEMRLKFWENAIETICKQSGEQGTVPDHPVVRKLKEVVDETDLGKHHLKRLVTARQRIGNLTFMTTKEMEDYCEQSVSSVYYAILEAAGVKNVHVDHAISHLGKAQGIVNLLRSVVHQSRSKYCVPVPQEVLMRHGVNQERMLRDQIEDKGVEEAVFEVATIAHQHLKKCRELKRTDFPPFVFQLLLPAIAIERYLDRLRYASFHVTNSQLQTRDQMLAFRYWLAKIRRQF